MSFIRSQITKSTYYILALLLVSISLTAQISPKDQNEIRKKAQKLLVDYEDKINQIGKEVKAMDKTRVNVESLLKLFVDRKTQVYNDLDPTHALSEYYEAETYGNNLALWYPNGIVIDLDFDNAQVSNVISHGEGVYSVDFIINKKISGAYLGRNLNTNTESLLFRVGFAGIGQQYQNFKIAGIRKPTQQNIDKADTRILEVRSTPLTPDERREIDRETRTLLNDYCNYLSLIGDTIEDIEEKILFKESFRALFSNNQSPVFNDILPDGMKNQFVPVSDYINLYSEAYSSEGGKVSFNNDSAELGYITKRNDTIYNRTVMVTKYFEGNYLGKRMVKFQKKLKLMIVFYFSNGVFKNFRIVKIDQQIEKKAEAAETRSFTDFRKKKPTISASTDKTGIPPPKEDNSKVMLSAGIIAGIGLINDQNLSSLTISENAHKWDIIPQFSYTFFANYTYKISPKLGLVTGIGYSKYETKYSLNSFSFGDSIFTDQTTYLDTNKVIYTKNIVAKVDSTVSLNTINIPVGLIFEFNPTGNLQYFIRSGINVAVNFKASSNTNSYMHYKGYYKSEKFEVFKYKDWPELGFYTKSSITPNRDIKSSFNSVAFNAFLDAGLRFPINEKMLLAFSGHVEYGLVNMVKNNGTYKDIFGQTETTIPYTKKHVFDFKPVNIFMYGIVVEFIVKL
jgi:hypothetical protein